MLVGGVSLDPPTRSNCSAHDRTQFTAQLEMGCAAAHGCITLLSTLDTAFAPALLSSPAHLSPLLLLPRLTALSYDSNPTDAQMTVLRQLKLHRLYLFFNLDHGLPRRLRTLALGADIAAVNASPSFSQLTRLDFSFRYQLSAEVLSEIAHYPALQSLPGIQSGMDLRAMGQLVHLRSLTELCLCRVPDGHFLPEADGEMSNRHGHLRIHAETLATILIDCPSLVCLRRLTLWHVHAPSDEIADRLFSAMPVLEDLSLKRPEDLASLRFLHHLRRLRCLKLDFDVTPPLLAPADLERIDLPALAYLCIREVEDGLVPTALVTSFVLPFARCPSLRCLSYDGLQRSNEGASVFIQLPEGKQFFRVLSSLCWRED